MPSDLVDLGDLIQQALREGRDVNITDADGYGYHIAVDGVPITEDPTGRGGLPWESWSFRVGDWHRTEAGEEKVGELIQGLKGWRAQRQNERLETDNQADAEGVE